MWWIDDRIGSRELVAPLKTMGVKASVKRLPYGDAFVRGGQTGTAKLGVERKTVAEICTAIRDTRFTGHQLPGLLQTYARVVLLVEGNVTVDRRTGLLMAGRFAAGFGPHRVMYSTYRSFLFTLTFKAGLHVELTRSLTESVHLLAALHQWWTRPWASHRSHLAVEQREADTAIFDERTAKRQTFAQWPEIGWTRSSDASTYWPSIQAAADGTVAQWANMPYRDINGKRHRFGPGRAATLVAFLQGAADAQGKG